MLHLHGVLYFINVYLYMLVESSIKNFFSRNYNPLEAITTTTSITQMMRWFRCSVVPSRTAAGGSTRRPACGSCLSRRWCEKAVPTPSPVRRIAAWPASPTLLVLAHGPHTSFCTACYARLLTTPVSGVCRPDPSS